MKVYPIEKRDRPKPPARPGEAHIFPLKPEPWRPRAACFGSGDPDAWFPEPDHAPERTERALATCRTECPVITECLLYALSHGQQDGIWGGMTRYQRARMLTESRRRAAESDDAA